MSKRAAFTVRVAGRNITATLQPLLLGLTVTLNSDGQADTADIALDDTGGRIAMPRAGAPIVIALGWTGEGQRIVFTGTVDAVRSRGGRGGRDLSITAKGLDALGSTKSSLRRHWDNATVKTILQDAAAEAGITKVSVDPALAGKTITYWAMIDESFLAMGRRLAKHIGGHFRIQGAEALMSRRGATYAVVATAAYGVNLHSWDISPAVANGVYGTVRATWYDRAEAAWQKVDVSTGLASSAILTIRPPAANEEEANEKAQSAAETIKRDSGGGSLTMEGEPTAIPDALCALVGARPGVSGAYRIASVNHSLSRGGGFTTTLELSQPQR